MTARRKYIMLTSEVIPMWKKLVLGALALFLMAAANLNCRCRVSIGGMELEGLYSPRAVDRCIEVARITA